MFKTKEITLNIGETFETKTLVTPAEEALSKVKYTVANDAVASVENGVITAKACGETIITAEALKNVTTEKKSYCK